LTKKKRYVSCLSILFFYYREHRGHREKKKKKNAEVAERRNERKFFKRYFFKNLPPFRVYTEAVKAIGFALEQSRYVVALPCSALRILKRL
jgi:hypothetical protein